MVRVAFRGKEALVAGEAIAAPSTGWLNLIHVEDAARIVLAAEAHARPPRLYTVSDGRPPQRGEYYEELARLLQAPPPKFVDRARFARRHAGRIEQAREQCPDAGGAERGTAVPQLSRRSGGDCGGSRKIMPPPGGGG